MDKKEQTFNFDFMGKRHICFVLSLVLAIGSIYIFVKGGDAKYGVDFTGGHELLVKVPGSSANSESIRAALNSNGMENAIVQNYEVGSDQFLVRIEGDASQANPLKTKIQEVLKAGFPGSSPEILRSDFVGPTVGDELKTRAVLAISLSLVGMLIFISYRFELAFAVGAVVALFHDVIITTGAYLLAGHTLSMGSLAASLTIVGYSVNDTIVIFDRIREEIHKQKKFNLMELMNYCMNLMLSRTLITHILTLFSALSLLIFGGGAISDLSLYLVVGVITGSYSTMYIACPVVLFWHRIRGGSIEQE